MDSNVRAGSSPAPSTNEKRPGQLTWFFVLERSRRARSEGSVKKQKTRGAQRPGLFSQLVRTGLSEANSRILDGTRNQAIPDRS